MINSNTAHINMVKKQIREGFVTDDQVLEVLKNIPREFFVPEQYKTMAYYDLQIPIGHQQVMMRPQEEALMLQALNIKATDNILEIGTGTGYITALLAKLGRHVTSVDLFADFIQNAEQKIQQLRIKNVSIEMRDALIQWFDDTSFDVIVITASLPLLPKKYLQTLTLYGRLFVIIGDAPAMTACVYHHQRKGFWNKQTYFETVLPQMIGYTKPKEFIF